MRRKQENAHKLFCQRKHEGESEKREMNLETSLFVEINMAMDKARRTMIKITSVRNSKLINALVRSSSWDGTAGVQYKGMETW